MIKSKIYYGLICGMTLIGFNGSCTPPPSNTPTINPDDYKNECIININGVPQTFIGVDFLYSYVLVNKNNHHQYITIPNESLPLDQGGSIVDHTSTYYFNTGSTYIRNYGNYFSYKDDTTAYGFYPYSKLAVNNDPSFKFWFLDTLDNGIILASEEISIPKSNPNNLAGIATHISNFPAHDVSCLPEAPFTDLPDTSGSSYYLQLNMASNSPLLHANLTNNDFPTACGDSIRIKELYCSCDLSYFNFNMGNWNFASQIGEWIYLFDYCTNTDMTTINYLSYYSSVTSTYLPARLNGFSIVGSFASYDASNHDYIMNNCKFIIVFDLKDVNGYIIEDLHAVSVLINS